MLAEKDLSSCVKFIFGLIDIFVVERVYWEKLTDLMSCLISEDWGQTLQKPLLANTKQRINMPFIHSYGQYSWSSWF
jgi:hypothetical protein